MKQHLLIFAVVALVGCGKKEDGNTSVVNPNKPQPKAVSEKLITDPFVEKEIHKELEKPEGELTKADYEKVTYLELRKNQLTDLKGLENLDQLKELYLQFNQLTEVPKGSEKLTQLRVLGLNENQLTSVKGLENLTQLELLGLRNNKLTSVKGLEKLTQLKKLVLYGNQLTSVKGLEKLTQLEFLSLDFNPDLTKAQIDQLKKALPNCGIGSNPTK